MATRMLRALGAAVLLVATAAAADAQCVGACSDGNTPYVSYFGQDASGWHQTAPPLFTNYYVPPTPCGPGAVLYVAPLPVPPHVGHTYVTYQPWMPHEYMHHHHRTYYKWHVRGGNYTKVNAFWW